MEYGWKEVPDIYFTTSDGILIGKNDVIKYYEEYYDGIGWQIQTISPLIDVDFFETLLSTTSFEAYVGSQMKRKTDGKTVKIWYAYYGGEIDNVLRQVGADAEPCEFIDKYRFKVREYITEKDLPESVKEELK